MRSMRFLMRCNKPIKCLLLPTFTSNVPDYSEAGPAAAGEYVAWFSECAEASTLFLSTEPAKRQSDSYWSYFAFSGKVVKGQNSETIKRW
jgi:hypothetical protein